MPLSVIEAMAKGLSVLATAVSGTEEELGNTGKLLPNPLINPEGTINGLVSMLDEWASEPTVRRSIGQACKQRAASLFTAKQMVERYSAIIEYSLAKRSVITG
jgi:glycosyltransferase involved in cell wall biosynthesis